MFQGADSCPNPGDEIQIHRTIASGATADVDPVIPDPIDRIVLDGYARLAAQVLDVPVVHISVLDEARGTVVSSCGLKSPAGSNASASFMKIVGVATECTAIPLMASDGRAVGALSVMDRKPCRWNASQVDFLEELAIRLVQLVDVGPVERVN